MAPAQSYVERLPVAPLDDLVRTVWVQRVGEDPYVQRNVPTGGVELQCLVGSLPRLVGPLTGPSVDVLAPGTTVVGVRFRPGAAGAVLGLPASELVDLTVGLDEIWGPEAAVLGELIASARSADVVLRLLQEHLIGRRGDGIRRDPLVSEAVRWLMPWRAGGVRSLSSRLAISPSQLRRRCLTAVGIGPKALQRTLRFQGFLALAQSTGMRTRSQDEGGGGGLAWLAAQAGYADHAHLSRECVRMTGLAPRAFLGDGTGLCDCGHDHAASFRPFLRGRPSGVGSSA